MSWFFLTVAAYFCLALSQVLDKVFLTHFVRESRAYGVIIGLMGALTLVAYPWLQPFPTTMLWILAVGGGALFVFALFPFMAALQGDEASRVITTTGALVPLMTVLMERLFLGTTLSLGAYLGIVLLVLGSVIMTSGKAQDGMPRSHRSLRLAVVSAFLFALSFVLTKDVYNQTDFLTAFVWMRVGGVFAALVMLMAVRPVQKELYRLFTAVKLSIWSAYLANQALAAIGFLLQSWAIALVSVGIITAMQGVQYVFVLFFVVVLSRYSPALFSERITKRIILEKMTATAFIILGLALLAI